MKELEERIRHYGKVIEPDVLKVNSFLNHGVDPILMDHIGKEFADHFKNNEITVVYTIESSGIAPALMSALYLGVPMVILKKNMSSTMSDDLLHATVTSFTKGNTYDLTIEKSLIHDTDRILFIDDFLANGQAAFGVIDLIGQTNASLVGIGIVIEKAFQNGRKLLKEKGYDVYALTSIKRMDSTTITFM